MKFIVALVISTIAVTLNAQEAAPETINWLTIEEAEAAAKKEPRKVIIDVYTDWCGWCKRMDKTTFQNPKLAAYVNAHFYAVKLDGEEKDSLTFLGKKYGFVSQGRRGYNMLPATLMNGKMSYPTVVFLDEELKMIQPIPGYQAPESFEQIITFLANDAYKEQPFEQYKKNYELRLSK
jgi:thioredoxin-related protein